MKMGKHKEPKDKQISSHCISFTAIYIYVYICIYVYVYVYVCMYMYVCVYV